MRTLTVTTSVVVASLLGLAAACSSPDIGVGGFGDQGTSGTSGASGASGSSGFGTSGSSGTDSDGGESCAAVAAETKKAAVDIIFVIDDSGSMNAEMTQIRTNVNTFASKIGTSGLDYTVTFIVRRGTNSGSNQICVPTPLAGPACADNPPLFHHVDQDVQSTDSFRLILSTYESSWKSYVRQDATKVFIEVSDDRSDMAYTAFDQQLLAKLPAGVFGTAAARNYIFHSIVSKPAGAAIPSTAVCSGAAGPSVDYQMLSQLTGGIVDEVCKTDYSGVLDNIAKGITDKLGCTLTYPSSDASDPTKVAVTFTPKGGAPQTLTQVTDVSKCASVPNAWYYDNAAAPTRILLCPTTCETANASPEAKLQALVGCKGAAPK